MEATVGRVRLGGIVEREVPPVLLEEFTKAFRAGRITLDLRRPSPQAAAAVVDSIAEVFPPKMFLARIAAPSPGEVEITLGEAAREAPMRFLADVLDTRVEFDEPPRIVVNVVPRPCARPANIRLQTAGKMEAPVGSLRENAKIQSGTSAKCLASHSAERRTRQACSSPSASARSHRPG